MFYQETLNQYFKSLQRLNRSPYTIDNYHTCLCALGEYLGDMELDQIGLSHLISWIDRAIEENPNPNTTWTKVVIVRTFFNWCVREELLKTSPARKLEKPQLPKRIPKASTDDEIQALIRAAQKSEICPERDTALVYFFLETGARRSAVAGLKTHDLSIRKCMAIVITKGDKEVKLFFGEFTKCALKKWLAIRDPKKFRPAVNPESVFGLTSDGIYQVIIRLKKSAGIERPLGPHVLRHTSATLRAEQGIDSSSLQQIMGWGDIRMAERYTSMSDDRLRRRALDTSPVDTFLAGR